MAYDSYVGNITMFGGNYAIVGTAFCHGQIVAISQNIALFSLLGTTYGGDGQSTFRLPDLRGRIPRGVGSTGGLANVVLGEVGGTESVTLTDLTMPSHTHILTATNSEGAGRSPAGGIPANGDKGVNVYGAATNLVTLGTSTAATGGSQPHSNIQPVLAVNFLIALEGDFPPRN